jgi:hypothetical protein
MRTLIVVVFSAVIFGSIGYKLGARGGHPLRVVSDSEQGVADVIGLDGAFQNAYSVQVNNDGYIYAVCLTPEELDDIAISAAARFGDSRESRRKIMENAWAWVTDSGILLARCVGGPTRGGVAMGGR